MFDAMGIVVHLCGDVPAASVSELLVGIDVGTQSSKGVLVRPDGSLVADARAEHGMEVPRPGWAEQDADAVWWADVVSIARRLSAAVPAGDRIAGVACSAIGPTVLPLDEAGRPLRTRDPVRRRHARDRTDRGARGPLRRRGAGGLSGHGSPARPSVRRSPGSPTTSPRSRERARWFVTATTYLVYRLTGEMVIDAHTASHFNPLFDPRAIAWSDRFADGITSLDRLPRIGWPADTVGAVTPAAAAETGLPAGIPVAVGTIDVLAEALSVGVAGPATS